LYEHRAKPGCASKDLQIPNNEEILHADNTDVYNSGERAKKENWTH
jgi:hypothetical protein